MRVLRRTGPPTRTRGFTLLELIVTLVILGIVVTALANWWRALLPQIGLDRDYAQNTQLMQTAMEHMLAAKRYGDLFSDDPREALVGLSSDELANRIKLADGLKEKVRLEVLEGPKDNFYVFEVEPVTSRWGTEPLRMTVVDFEQRP
ncbi:MULTISPECIES: type II secretion system protein [Halorhodospira]|uniref:type II secretion system protein n=1 Tax=Halorhodospira TaxID=85108 RepID=UPI001EE9209D|nr:MULTISPECIES: type II secretion system protein [Halorhodospira]MCG5528634.1 type II secretion system GspH family protein [Halorhodospira halophila]MCG5541947.1 type II secretion system GspH family protein [Halorhodospira sp. M39old]MCG5543961.1 type II secretion system GspH family protein [Halorhodospira sp. 9628]MCG5547017.1 type II secretion system GspH family protein [Halorhodospira sp. M38]